MLWPLTMGINNLGLSSNLASFVGTILQKEFSNGVGSLPEGTNPQEALDSFIVDFEPHSEHPQAGKSSLHYPWFSDKSPGTLSFKRVSTLVTALAGWNGEETVPVVILRTTRPRMLLASPGR